MGESVVLVHVSICIITTCKYLYRPFYFQKGSAGGGGTHLYYKKNVLSCRDRVIELPK